MDLEQIFSVMLASRTPFVLKTLGIQAILLNMHTKVITLYLVLSINHIFIFSDDFQCGDLLLQKFEFLSPRGAYLTLFSLIKVFVKRSGGKFIFRILTQTCVLILEFDLQVSLVNFGISRESGEFKLFWNS